MTFTPAATDPKIITDREIALYFDLFKEEAGLLIATGLKDIEANLVFHNLPGNEKYATTLQLFGKETVTTEIAEFADYRDLATIEPKDVKAEVKALAAMFASSYLGNVRNAYIKNGRLRYNEKLHVTYWDTALKINVVSNEFSGVNKAGWAAFRYKFAAAKI